MLIFISLKTILTKICSNSKLEERAPVVTTFDMTGSGNRYFTNIFLHNNSVFLVGQYYDSVDKMILYKTDLDFNQQAFNAYDYNYRDRVVDIDKANSFMYIMRIAGNISLSFRSTLVTILYLSLGTLT